MAATGARILIIEDNPPNLELMRYLLEAFGHCPLLASNGEQGLAKAFAEAPDLVLCDVHLPDLHGYEVVSRLKAHPALQHKPVVAVTAFAMVGDRDKTLAAGFDGYIAKPITADSFVAQVESFLPAEKRSIMFPPATTSLTSEMAAPGCVQHATILVVDDSSANLGLTRSLLEPSGYSVLAARGVSEALALAQRHRPDLILTDLHMPEKSGTELLRAVRALDALQSTPVLIISSTSRDSSDREEHLALGAADFIYRPIHPQDLLGKIEACLKK